MVVNVLDPNRNLIRGTIYSARAEYLHVCSGINPKRPPKDLRSLYAYCIDQNKLEIPIEPIILDDNEGMWKRDQQENIIVRCNLTLGCQGRVIVIRLECIFVPCYSTSSAAYS